MFTNDLIQILSQEEDARFVDGDKPHRFVRVRFKVGKFGPFTQEFPRDNYTAAARDLKLQQIGREVWVDPPTTPTV